MGPLQFAATNLLPRVCRGCRAPRYNNALNETEHQIVCVKFIHGILRLQRKTPNFSLINFISMSFRSIVPSSDVNYFIWTFLLHLTFGFFSRFYWTIIWCCPFLSVLHFSVRFRIPFLSYTDFLREQ
jgi:hypothetical protein